jgi:hypothetical protein
MQPEYFPPYPLYPVSADGIAIPSPRGHQDSCYILMIIPVDQLQTFGTHKRRRREEISDIPASSNPFFPSKAFSHRKC